MKKYINGILSIGTVTLLFYTLFDLKNQGYAAIKGRWEKALSEEVAKGNWSAIPEPMISASK